MILKFYRLVFLISFCTLLTFLPACGEDSGDDDDDNDTSDSSSPGETAMWTGPQIWVTGLAIGEDASSGFLLRHLGGSWHASDLDLPFANVNFYAMAAPATGDPWLAGEGAVSLETPSLTPFLYRINRESLVEIKLPPISLAITSIAPYEDDTAWIVGAQRTGGTLVGYAAFWDGTTWTEDAPEVPANVAQWNLSAADFPTPDAGAVLGLIREEGGSCLYGAVFQYTKGQWQRLPVDFDTQADFFIFTDIHYTPTDVTVAGRVNLAGWIAHVNPQDGQWWQEDLTFLNELSPMWEINSIAHTDEGTRYALGSYDVAGFQQPLILHDAGNGWIWQEMPDSSDSGNYQRQARNAVFLSEDDGMALVSRYYYNEGIYLDEDYLLQWNGGEWSEQEPLTLAERYQLRQIAVVNGN